MFMSFQTVEKRLAEAPDTLIVDEVMGQEADRLVRVGVAVEPSRDRGRKPRHDRFLGQEAAAAGPIDRIDVGVDLAKPRRRLPQAAIPETREAAIAETRKQRQKLGRGPIPRRNEDGEELCPARCLGKAKPGVGVAGERRERAMATELGLLLAGWGVVEVGAT